MGFWPTVGAERTEGFEAKRNNQFSGDNKSDAEWLLIANIIEQRTICKQPILSV